MHTGAPSGCVSVVPPHLLKPPPPQYWGSWQVPHCRTLPHPSLFSPHVYPRSLHVFGLQLPGPLSPPASLKRLPVSPPEPVDESLPVDASSPSPNWLGFPLLPHDATAAPHVQPIASTHSQRPKLETTIRRYPPSLTPILREAPADSNGGTTSAGKEAGLPPTTFGSFAEEDSQGVRRPTPPESLP